MNGHRQHVCAVLLRITKIRQGDGPMRSALPEEAGAVRVAPGDTYVLRDVDGELVEIKVEA